MPHVKKMTQSGCSYLKKLIQRGARFGLRYLDKKERSKYGCAYCRYTCGFYKGNLFEVWSIDGIGKGTLGSLYCPYKECPYLDEFKRYHSYDDYDRAERIKWKNKNWSI